MTNLEARVIARRVGILALRKKELEDEIKNLKNKLLPVMHRCKTEESASGNIQHVLDDVDGFTCKSYVREMLYANQEKARELLAPNTFNAIFKPSLSEIVDIRPTSATKRLAIDTLFAEIE